MIKDTVFKSSEDINAFVKAKDLRRKNVININSEYITEKDTGKILLIYKLFYWIENE